MTTNQPDQENKMINKNTNTNLGLYDMVMAMSENSVNYLLKNLLDDGIIKDTWNVRVEYNDDDEVENVLINDSKNLKEYNEKFTIGQDGFYANIEVYDFSKDEIEKLKKWDTLSKSEKELLKKNYNLTEEQLNDLAKFPYPIYIDIKNKTPHSVLFAIRFKEGVYKYTSKKGVINSIKLDGMVYKFSVDLEKSSKSYPDFMKSNDATNKTKDIITKQLDDKAKHELKSEIFTIENLFLDLENANFVNYDARSIFPPGLDPDKDIAKITSFQKLLSTYFKADRIKRDENGTPILDDDGKEIIDNPYVLGYSITLPDLEHREKAVFEPCSLDFSSSHSENTNLSTLNYLMMTEKKSSELERNPLLGILDSLIDKKTEKDVDAILGIDSDLFYKKIISDIVINVQEKINNYLNDIDDLKERQPSVFDFYHSKSQITHNGVICFKKYTSFKSLLDHGLKTEKAAKISIESTFSQGGEGGSAGTYAGRFKYIMVSPYISVNINNGKLEILVNFRINIEYKYEHTTWIFFKKTKKAETSNYTNGGDCNKIKLTIKPGIKGKFDIESKLMEDEKFVVISGDKSAIKDVDREFGDDSIYFFYHKLQNKEFIGKITSELSSFVATLPEIVLPISNLYSYKSIALLKDNVITIQSNYTSKK